MKESVERPLDNEIHDLKSSSHNHQSPKNLSKDWENID
jgi:hypothetical protein